MSARTLPKALTDCLAPSASVTTIRAAAELIAEEMKALPGNLYERYRIDINTDLGFVLIVGRAK